MPLIRTVDLFFRVIDFLVILRVFLSWVPLAFNSNVIRFIYQVTDPIIEPGIETPIFVSYLTFFPQAYF